MKKVVSKSEWNSFVGSHDNFLFDMDGVLWRGETMIEGAVEAVNDLMRLGKRVFFVTNNSTKTRSDYARKFAKLGFNSVTADMIFGASYAVALYLDSIQYPKAAPIFLCGGEGLRDELAAHGYTTIQPVPALRGNFTSVESICEMPLDPAVGAVICGFDGTISYVKLSIAHSYLIGSAAPAGAVAQKPVLFIATNADSTYPAPDGRTLMGSGSLYAPLVSSTGRSPVVCGKPNRLMMDLILNTHKLDPQRTCMIGDRLDTDVQFGKSGGCRTMLVLSGCTPESAVLEATSAAQPDYYSAGIASFLTSI